MKRETTIKSQKGQQKGYGLCVYNTNKEKRAKGVEHRLRRAIKKFATRPNWGSELPKGKDEGIKRKEKETTLIVRWAC